MTHPASQPKIVHMLPGKANPESQNGVNKIVYNLALEQSRLGHPTEVWGITRTPERPGHEPPFELRLFKRNHNRFALDPSLGRALGELPAGSVVHFHSVFIPEHMRASKILRRNGIEWVTTPHGGYSPLSMKHHQFRKRVFLSLFERRFLISAKAVQATGDAEVRDTRAIASTANVVQIPNGQDLADLEYEHSRIKGSGSPVFGFCGRLAIQHKGLDLLFRGFEIHVAGGGTGELWLIGDSGDRPELEALAKRLNIIDRVSFLGALYGQEKLNRIGNMDVFVHTSRWEGLPMSVLEAAGLGIPLLITEATNLGRKTREWNCGIVLAENSPETIATALETAAEQFRSGELARAGKNAAEMIRTDFIWPVVAKRLVDEAYKLGPPNEV